MGRHTSAVYLSRTTDTETNTCEVLGAQFLNNIRDTIVAGGSGRISEFVGAGDDIKIVMEDDDVFGLEFVEMYQLTDGGAGSIHERRWFHEEHLVFADRSLAYFC